MSVKQRVAKSEVGSEIVFPPDTRTEVSNTTEYPYKTIGQIEMTFPNGKSYLGTGTLIDPYWVLTCAHNLYSSGDGGYAKQVSFIPARNAGEEPYGSYRATGLFCPSEYRSLQVPNPNATKDVVFDDTQYMYDFGLFRLDRPVPVGEIFPQMWAASESQLNASTVSITGYPGDKPFGTMWTASGRLEEDPPEEFLFYTISTYNGQSGSGLLDFGDRSYGQIVGIHIAGAVDLETNFAVRLNQDNIDRILGWMAGS